MDDGSALPCRGPRAWLDVAGIPKCVTLSLKATPTNPAHNQSIDVSYFAQTPDGHKA
jgi:hypothetical protein